MTLEKSPVAKNELTTHIKTNIVGLDISIDNTTGKKNKIQGQYQRRQ
jgi:hypothetical protein